MSLKKVLLATKNRGKVEEMKRLLEAYGIHVELPERDIEVEESGSSFLENAYLKAQAYHREYLMPVLADDSGLVIPSLDGYPGVFSSRFYQHEYGGKEEVVSDKDEANIRKVLRLMKGKQDRSAKFVAFLMLSCGDAGYWAKGECIGKILEEPRGSGGFGYDPIFQPEGSDKSMAELKPGEKDAISHRGRAVRNLVSIIKSGGML
ncbi:MAG: RdgB/HAM1 family non-canonical purine NTP pyrophosphatase [Hydrogenobacter thermophilus]|uniref:RdgB/HAM1 family non-canonical purine NTP pyrophosphatase n=1 Tax=Hydrogenobacter thermophilus TaxID=940 RepID=UPI001C7732CA|nr:RdgB/HAM1 family non-canonical purine NTP pyrophosphatase [Hydrogenobacter thermophilus]QWK19374.1 MAG: RdgB/HAM1 family non-canonical purine NTP pyrophosphatase [Hydrogenobacter thermophilus]